MMAKSIRKILKTFTLVELVIVIAIILVLGSGAFLIFSQWIGKSRDVKKLSDLSTIEKSIKLSLVNNSGLPKPDDSTDILFSGNKIWELGYFGLGAIEFVGGSLTKLPIDPTTKERYLYAQWNNSKYQLGTIVENYDYSKYSNRVYSNSYFTKLQGTYDQTIIIAKIDGVDNLLPVPSLILDKVDTATIDLDEERFWINNQKFSFNSNGVGKIKVQSLYSGNISNLRNNDEFSLFKEKYKQVYGSNQDLLYLTSDDNIDENLLEELNKINTTIIGVDYLTCDGIAHGKSKLFYLSGSVNHGNSCSSIEKSFECKNGKWMDGFDEADLLEYKYSGCVVGNPVDCLPTSITKKSVSQLDMLFEIPQTLHGLSFDINNEVEENNGNYEYKLVGFCNNGIYEEVLLGEPVYKSCSSGYANSGNICLPMNCQESTQTVNGHIYNVGAIVHGGLLSVTSNSIPISNGEISYTQTFQCNLGTITISGSETTNTPTCNNNYFPSGGSCELNTYTVSGSFGANASGATVNVCGSGVTADASGNFSRTGVGHGTNCSNITATRSGYNCNVTTQGPESLIDNVTNVSGSCSLERIWTGDVVNGFTFREGGITKYPKSCNDLLVSSNPNFKLGVGAAYNGTNFTDGYYFIDLDGVGALPVLKVYCDMSTDSGGRTRISYNQTTSFTTARYASCKNNGYHFITNFECISPIYFTNIRFKRSGYTDVFVPASNAQYVTQPTRYGWQFNTSASNRYTMRDYNHATSGFNTGRWGPSHGKFQNDIRVWGK